MSIAELKNEIYKIIDRTNDEEVLENYLEIMNSENITTIERIEKSEKFKKEIETSREQIKNGQVIPHEEMKKRMFEWKSR